MKGDKGDQSVLLFKESNFFFFQPTTKSFSLFLATKLCYKIFLYDCLSPSNCIIFLAKCIKYFFFPLGPSSLLYCHQGWNIFWYFFIIKSSLFQTPHRTFYFKLDHILANNYKILWCLFSSYLGVGSHFILSLQVSQKVIKWVQL